MICLLHDFFCSYTEIILKEKLFPHLPGIMNKDEDEAGEE